MTNPYQSPQPAEPGQRPKKRPRSFSTPVGLMCIVLACVGLSQGIQRPPNSRGDLLDDLPFIAGQLFVPLALFVVGSFLFWRGRTRKAAK